MPEVMLSNADVSVAVSRRAEAMPYAYRNLDGDLLHFVHKGTGAFATEFGRVAYEPGDYVLIPKGITFSLMPDAGDQLMLVIEAPGECPECGGWGRGRYDWPIDCWLATGCEFRWELAGAAMMV
jgi:homogentisate 1,2-dioxygenase